MSRLKQYQAIRDFKRTSEPKGTADARRGVSSMKGGRFVVHKHAARRLHYDLRLEQNGVLWSWAVTRGPSRDPTQKRLAVHVEDHPLDYGAFEGTIPKGAYGAGSVIVWDEGYWVPVDDPVAGMKKGHINFELKGEKLKGNWHLVRLKPRAKEKRDNWLLIKSDDADARPDDTMLDDSPLSTKSGLTVEEIGESRPAKVAKPGADKPQRQKLAMPDFIAPALATLKAKPPSGEEWLHEVKFDGYRIQAHVASEKVRLLTRSGLNWTGRFGAQVAGELARLSCAQAIVDGEMVVLSDAGIASFSALQSDLSDGHTDRMVYYAFDLLYLDGTSWRDAPLKDRKARLADLLRHQKADSPLRFSEHFEASGEVMLAHACRMGLEGVVSKRAGSPYRSGRTLAWIKSKCVQRQEFVIVGYLPSTATGRGLKSLLLAYHQNGKLTYAGLVGTGFSAKSGDDLKRKLDSIKTAAPAIASLAAKQKHAVWVRPVLVAEVAFRAWSDGRILRQASFKGLREDKEAVDIIKESQSKPAPAANGRSQSGERRFKAPVKVAAPKTSVELSNPDKVLWPEAKITKQDLLAYYGTVWPRMKSLVINRPLSLVRAPDGIGGERFFQKHASPGMHKAIHEMKDPAGGGELLYIKDFDGLAALVQLGAVEIHIWGAKIDAIETPDQIVFDLDPDEGFNVAEVRAAALEIKERMDSLGLPALLKTSGGKGFHIVVPLKPKARWEEVKAFSRDFALAMAQANPDRYTATLSKKARKGRIFIDYLRNVRGATAVSPYSLRANMAAAISMPVAWISLERGVSPQTFAFDGDAMRNVLREPNPWASISLIAKALRG